MSSDTGHTFSLARRLKAGEAVYSGWCGIAAPQVAETLAREGFHAVTFDQQHGLYDMATTAAGIAAVHHGGAAPIVRVPLGDFAVAARALDFGAEAVIAPMINTAEDARAFVAATKYPPLGQRSWGPHRAVALGRMPDQKFYLGEANNLTLTFAMIETRTALDNIDAIAATPGIDALFLGPSDLSIALSNGSTLDPVSADVERELDRIVAAARKHGKIPGAYCSNAARAKAVEARGMRFMAIGSDLGLLRAGIAIEMKVLQNT